MKTNKSFAYGVSAAVIALAFAALSVTGCPNEPAPAHTHQWGEWVIVTAPTATKNGLKTRTCELNAAHTEDETIPATGIKADPAVTWPQGLTAFYGQTLSNISLVSYTNNGGTPGAFSWTSPSDSVGDLGAQPHNMTFTPTDTADYNTLTQNVNITVNKAGVTAADITITGPVKGATPAATAMTSDTNYTCGAVSWSPDNNPFLGGAVYTASVTLTADSNHTFTGLSSATVNGQNAAISNNTSAAVTLSRTFPATDTRTVTNIAIKTQPANLTYTHGDTLDLAGLAVTLTHDDATTEDAAAPEFTAQNITANPAHGVHLAHVTHNGQPVTITYGNLPQLTAGNLTVNKAPGNFGTPAAFNTTYTPVLTLGNITLPAGYVWVIPSTSLNTGNNQSFAATYTDPSGNYESASGSITVNVAKAAGIFTTHAAINTTYTPGLTLAALNAQLSSGYAWNAPSTSLNAGNNQPFAATYINPNGNYEAASGVITVNVAKAAGVTVNAPAAAATGANSVTLNAVSASTGQAVEYAKNSTNTAPSTGWQTGTTFNGLSAGNVYYFFARSQENGNYNTGAASGGTAITTKQQAGNDIIGYWVDDTGEISIGTGGQGNIVTVQYGGSVTFTADGAGYSNQSWTLNGNAAGTGASYTFDTADNDKESGRNYIIGLRVQKDGKFYFTEITVRVVE